MKTGVPELQALLGRSSDDVMYACYPVDKKHVRSGDEMLNVYWVDIGLQCPRFSTSKLRPLALGALRAVEDEL